jgi:hypothetical protein
MGAPISWSQMYCMRVRGGYDGGTGVRYADITNMTNVPDDMYSIVVEST